MPQQFDPHANREHQLEQLLRDACYLFTMDEGNILVLCEDAANPRRDGSHFSTVYRMSRDAWLFRAGEMLEKEVNR